MVVRTAEGAEVSGDNRRRETGRTDTACPDSIESVSDPTLLAANNCPKKSLRVGEHGLRCGVLLADALIGEHLDSPCRTPARQVLKGLLAGLQY